MNLEKYYPAIHSAIRGLPETSLWSKEDFFNEGVLILIETLKRNKNNDSFVSFFIKTLRGKLLNKIIPDLSIDVEEYNEKTVIKIIDYDEYANVISSYEKKLKDPLLKELFHDVILNKSVTAKAVLKANKQPYSKNRLVKWLEADFRNFVFDNYEELI